MVPEIRHFPSDEFYEGRLKDSTDRAARNFPKKLGSLALNNHFFFDLKYGREGQSRFSYFNEEEIK
jgi:superfamily I DNA and/or RNA helicase